MVLQRYMVEYGLDCGDLLGVGFQWKRKSVPLIFGLCDDFVCGGGRYAKSIPGTIIEIQDKQWLDYTPTGVVVSSCVASGLSEDARDSDGWGQGCITRDSGKTWMSDCMNKNDLDKVTTSD